MTTELPAVDAPVQRAERRPERRHDTAPTGLDRGRSSGLDGLRFLGPIRRASPVPSGDVTVRQLIRRLIGRAESTPIADFERSAGQPSGVIAAFVDTAPIFQLEALRWFRTAVDLAGVSPRDLLIGTPDPDTEVGRYLSEQGVRVHRVEPFDPRSPHCNKIANALAVADLADGVVVLTDTDVAFLDDPRAIAVPEGHVAAKVVDYGLPPIDRLRLIFDTAGAAHPAETTSSNSGEPTFSTNFNGGIYVMQVDDLRQLAGAWRQRALFLLDHIELLDAWAVYVDQVAFALAVADTGLAHIPLPISWNYPVHVPAAAEPVGEWPHLIHYHRETDVTGLLKYTQNHKVNAGIQRLNAAISRQWKSWFPNATFWSHRYAANPELGSGTGSRGDPLAAKRTMLEALAREFAPASTLDVGCGDGQATQGLALGAYTGVDLSPDAIALAKKGRPDGTYVTSLEEAGDAFDLVLSLDVLIHPSRVEEYRALVKNLANRAARALVVSGYDVPPTAASPMIHFHEQLSATLRAIDPSYELYPLRYEHEITTFLVLRRPIERHPRDFSANERQDLLRRNPRPVLLAAMQSLAWTTVVFYPNHEPRFIEYPLVATAIRDRLQAGAQVLDVGAGVNPLVPYLTAIGFHVDTLDPSNDIRVWPPKPDWNEWGYLDLGELDFARRSYNAVMEDVLDELPQYDATFSVSVIEHLPAVTRRALLGSMFSKTAKGGWTLLTIDVERGKHALWNKNLGAQVDIPHEHGTFEDVLSEATSAGYHVDLHEIIRDVGHPQVDIGWIVLRKATSAAP